MLPTTLNTNEVKDAAGAELEFQRLNTDMRQLEFGLIGEVPSNPHRLKVSHQEIGSGATKRRRSAVRVDLTVTGTSTLPRVISAYVVVDIPVGDIANYDNAKKVLANLMSFCASLGASTTILYDCTGNGASALINGSL